jgi:hypothetical protein
MISLSCGVYTFTPSALGGVKSVAIPLWEDQTTEPGIREMLTEGVSQAFVDDNTLKVVAEARADAVLRGVIRSYSHDPYTYSAGEVVSEYIVTIGIGIEFKERKSGKIIWEESNMSNWGTYLSDSQTEQDGQKAAVDKLVEDILNKTVKGW